MTLDLETLELKSGAHKSPDDGGCVMEWVSVFAGMPWTDHPECTDPIVAVYARLLNDRMPDDQRQKLIPLIPLLAGTKNGVSAKTRAFMCADRAVRVFAPLALDAAGKTEEAAKLRALAPIVDRETVERGREAAEAAWEAAAAAEAAAEAAWAAEAAAEAWAACWDEAVQLLKDLCEARTAR